MGITKALEAVTQRSDGLKAVFNTITSDKVKNIHGRVGGDVERLVRDDINTNWFHSFLQCETRNDCSIIGKI